MSLDTATCTLNIDTADDNDAGKYKKLDFEAIIIDANGQQRADKGFQIQVYPPTPYCETKITLFPTSILN